MGSDEQSRVHVQPLRSAIEDTLVTAPATIIVVHPREKRSKCTVEPLRGHGEFEFWTFPDRKREDLSGYVRLGIGGKELSEADAESGLVVLDGTWKLAEKMEPFYRDVPVRSLPPWRTAYPRVSKLFEDPAAGLATIEAIYAAHTILGRDTSNLLDGYYWADHFVELNQSHMTKAP